VKKDEIPLPIGIKGRLLEICYERYGIKDFNELAKIYYPNTKFTFMNYQWCSANGFLFPVFNMSKKHITNTINCLSGKTKTNYIPDEHFVKCHPRNLNREEWINVFLEELRDRLQIKKNKLV